MSTLDIEKAIREYIDGLMHLSLGTATVDGKPWVCEVHFAYDENLNLYFVSKKDTRHCQEIAANSFVAGNIVKQHPLEESPHGVYFEGTAEVVEPTDAQLEVYCSRLGRDKAELTEQLQERDVRGMYKIAVRNWAIFGKFGLDANHKHKLKWDGGR
jgi:uncharacterized protein YhbP (UPF0306 family)